MRITYRYQLKLTQFQNLNLPTSHRILSAYIHNSSVFLWADFDVNDKLELSTVEFMFLETGKEYNDQDWEHITSVSQSMGENYIPLCWHIFKSK